MKVILRSAVDSLGQPGEIKDVSAGFGRNYLFPRRLAEPATPAAIAWWQKGQERRAKLADKSLQEMKVLAEKLQGLSLSFVRQAGAEGKLFGSVGKTDIVKSLKACGHTVDKSAIVLDAAIKAVGESEVELQLAPAVGAKIKVSVVARQ